MEKVEKQNIDVNLTCGGWTSYREVTKEDQRVFNEAMEGFVGIAYEPIKVSTQVVAGINYRFICKASLPGSEGAWEAVVQIYEPLEGKPYITKIDNIDSCGSWCPYHELTKQDQKIFDEAMEGFVGVHYIPFMVSTQIVSGTNYRFRCRATLPGSEAMWESIVEIYAPLNEKPHITHINPC